MKLTKMMKGGVEDVDNGEEDIAGIIAPRTMKQVRQKLIG